MDNFWRAGHPAFKERLAEVKEEIRRKQDPRNYEKRLEPIYITEEFSPKRPVEKQQKFMPLHNERTREWCAGAYQSLCLRIMNCKARQKNSEMLTMKQVTSSTWWSTARQTLVCHIILAAQAMAGELAVMINGDINKKYQILTIYLFPKIQNPTFMKW